MPDQLKDVDVQQYKTGEQQQELREVPALDTSLNALAKVGGFDFLEAVVDGADSMNPARKAKRNIFLTDASKKDQRAELKQKLKLWIDLLAEGGSVSEMVDKAVEKADTAERLLKDNLKKVLQTTRTLEESYRSVHLFFKNTTWQS